MLMKVRIRIKEVEVIFGEVHFGLEAVRIGQVLS